MAKKTVYWITEWAKLRQNEIVRIPKDYVIHSDFVRNSNKTNIKAVFAEINSLFTNIYGDIIQAPQDFGIPLYDKEKYRVFSKEWRDSGQAPYRPFILLYNLFTNGEYKNNSVFVSIEKYKNIKLPPKHLSGFDLKISNTQFLFKKLIDYGFVFVGLKNDKPANDDIIISYPDNSTLLYLFKKLADKAFNTNRLADFLCCSFRLLQDDMNTANYGCVEDMVDKVHTDAEREFVLNMDKTLISKGLFRKSYGGYEGTGLAYYRSKKIMESKGPYSFRMISGSTDISDITDEKLQLGLRIRNIPNCLEYLEKCPDTIKNIFTDKNDKGCGKRKDNSCKHAVKYKMDGKNYWRCACCHTPFYFKPQSKDIAHYIKLVELGEK